MNFSTGKKKLIARLNSRKTLLKPPPKLTVSEWADRYRIISAGNAEPGRWRTARAPYQREPMDIMTDPSCHTITLMWGAQLGKTEIINNGIGYHIHQNPVSQMMMHPTNGDLTTWLETKLTPLLSDTPEISERVAKARGRDGVNNQKMKSYPGGFLMFAWSGSPNTMRGRSAPRINCDEVDGYETTSEGDPISLLSQRAATFGDMAQLLVTSTPTVKGESRVETYFEQGDQRRFYLPCPHCEEFQTLVWANVTWDKDEDGNHLPETAFYACNHCGGIINDGHKLAMLQRGEWRAAKPYRGHASFHLSELYSPFRKFSDIARSFLSKKAANDLQTFVNVSLAETWEEEGETVDANALYLRREYYPARVPAGAVVLVASVDVQDDRLECAVFGFGGKDGSECWLITADIFRGDPGRRELWDRLDEFLLQRFEHESGLFLSIAATAVDSGGHYTQEVYKFCKARESRRVYAIKGKSQAAAPIVGRPSKSNNLGALLFPVGSDTAKELIFSRLRIANPGPGYIHFPMGEAAIDEEFFQQLTAEKRVTTYKNGFPVKVFKKIRRRNEALDLFVYGLVALEILRPNFKTLAKKLEPVEPEPEPENPEPVDDLAPQKVQTRRRRPPRKKSGGFVKGY